MKDLMINLVSTLALLSLLLAGTPVRRAHAAGIVVNTAADQDNGLAMIADGKCGLREAINNANSTVAPYQPNPECDPGSSGADTISFAGNYTITLGAQNELLVTSPITIQGNGAANTIIEADPAPNTSAYRVLEVSSTGDLSLDSLTVRNGRCAGSCATYGTLGGGILNHGGTLSLVGTTVSANSAVDATVNNSGAGGIFNYDGSSFSMTDSILSENSAEIGGGIMSSASSLTVIGSTFSGNSAVNGGGLYIYPSGSSPILTNVTFSGNSADSGGGIYNNGHSPQLTNVTFSGNHAGEGGGMYNNGGSALLKNTIIANSTAPILPVKDCDGPIDAASSNNLIESSSHACGLTDGVSGNIVGLDPSLGALADNGGPSQTFALLAGSPAIDAGQSAACPAGDQRGIARPQGPGCDIGAFELEQSTTILQSINTQDGWILESSETSGQGGTKNAGGTTFNLGDNAARKQYRAVLSFDTSLLPVNAVITGATLSFKKAGLQGANPFKSLGKILVDIKDGSFSNNAALQTKDFQAGADKKGMLKIGSQQVNGWYSKSLAATNLTFISQAGATQFRLRFAKDDNNNAVANYLKFYSGDADALNRPELTITYYVP